MTDLDPDAQRAHAADAITHLLAGRLLPGMDAAHIAAQALDIVHEHGGRFVSRSDRIPEQGRKDPAVAVRGAEQPASGSPAASPAPTAPPKETPMPSEHGDYDPSVGRTNPLTLPPPEQTERCGAETDSAILGPCALPIGHEGTLHIGLSGIAWEPKGEAR